MKNWRLRTRLILAYAGLMLLGFGSLGLLAGRQITRGATEDFEHNLETQAILIARSLTERVEHYQEGEISGAEVQTAVNETAAALEMRLTLVDNQGNAWLDSLGLLPTAPLQHDLEIAAALAGEITHDVRPAGENQTIIYTAAPIIEDGRLLAVVRLAVPESAALTAVRQRQLALLGGVLLLTLCALLAALWLSASLTRPLEALQTSAMRLAAGDFSHRPAADRQDEVGQLTQAFNHMADRLQAMLAAQKAFASNASHELRTPLTAIRLRSEALRDNALDTETSRQYIAEIDDEVARLSRLVNDLILLSRLESGREVWEQEHLDPMRLALVLHRQFEPVAAARQIAFHLKAPPSLPPVRANQNHFRTVLHNLLDNALRYTPDGGEVRWQIGVEDNLLFSQIQDNGQGIAPADLPHLFERFYRADKAHSRTGGGVGLGLSLTQSIVQIYHGRLTIESAGLGQGSTVKLWWPLAAEYNEPT